MHIPTRTLTYLAVVFGILVIPRALQRVRLPAPLTCFALGIVAAVFYAPLKGDRVFAVVATLGIASLFLSAGLEVDLEEIRKQLPRLSGHLGTRALFLVGAGWLVMCYLHLSWQPAVLLVLGLVTPSTGFILDTLTESGLEADEQNEVSISAIASEITALLVLFVVSQSTSITTLAISSLALILLIVLTPIFFLALGKYVVPYAQGSEFSLLMMVGIICAVISENLGVHVLVGAFVAGLVAGLLRERMTTLASDDNLLAVRLFSSFFIPFYFFHEGLEVPAGAFVLKSLLYGFALCAVLLPLRIAKNWLECRIVTKRNSRSSLRVAISLSPTLIFTLVIAGMLHTSFHIEDALYGGLLVYAAVSSVLPAFVLPGIRRLLPEQEPGTLG
jgi:Kef-type K+ transport system membrane component KefB